MQWNVTITIADASDVFEITERLKSLKGLEGVKLSGAVPRPEPRVAPATTQNVQTGVSRPDARVSQHRHV